MTDSSQSYCITYSYPLEDCDELEQKRFTCKVDDLEGYEKVTTLNLFRGGKADIWMFMMLRFGSIVICLILCQLFNCEETTCDNAEYGAGQAGDKSRAQCKAGQEGDKSAICQETGNWKLIEDRCILIEIKEQLLESVVGDLHVFVFVDFLTLAGYVRSGEVACYLESVLFAVSSGLSWNEVTIGKCSLIGY